MSAVYLATNFDSGLKIGETKNPSQRERALRREGYIMDRIYEIGGGETERKFVEGFIRLCLESSGLAERVSLDYFDCDNQEIYNYIAEKYYGDWVDEAQEIISKIYNAKYNKPLIMPNICENCFDLDICNTWKIITNQLKMYGKANYHRQFKKRQIEILESQLAKYFLGSELFDYNMEINNWWVYLSFERKQ